MSADLEQPLPSDAIVGMTWGPFRYRKYPVFSWPWLKWRTMSVSVAIMLYGALSALGLLAAKHTLAECLNSTAYFIVTCVLMVTAGPGLASWVRTRRWSAATEAKAVIVAVVIGFVSAAVLDYFGSKGVAKSIKEVEVPRSERRISKLDEARIGIGIMSGWFLYFAGSGGLAALAYFSERRRMKARGAALAQLESDMRLTVLQAQIEPHFLFNTLASIRPLIRQEANRAESALDALAAHLRSVIPQMREQSMASSLGQQADICASYLEVMKLRMGERLHVAIHVPSELRAHPFPPLMLLSLVENAIKHGIEPKPGSGSISVSAVRTGHELHVTVTDDGLGLKEGLSSGLGLANIREQLTLRHRNASRLSVAARAEGGTVAEIVVPFQPLLS
jgi:hypothetical protein